VSLAFEMTPSASLWMQKTWPNIQGKLNFIHKNSKCQICLFYIIIRILLLSMTISFFLLITLLLKTSLLKQKTWRGYHWLKVDIFDHILGIRSEEGGIRSVLGIRNDAFDVISNSKDIVNFLSVIFCRVVNYFCHNCYFSHNENNRLKL
jgi:hypothetical protein